MRGFVRNILSPPNRLPDAIFAELVAGIFTALPPVTLIGTIVTAVGTLFALKNDDPVLWLLIGLCVAVTVGRIALILAYRRRARTERALNPARWECCFAAGAYAFALVLGAFNYRAITTGDAMVAMLVTSIMFGYGAGMVVRLGVRPTLCTVSLWLAVVPTAIGYLGDAASAGDYYVMAMYCGQAILLVAFTVAGMEAMGHIYRTTLAQLLTQQDLATLAGHDTLTGLPNRMLLRARFEEAIAQLERGDTLLAYHCLDLDHFKEVNDERGHAAGDALLKLVAERLRDVLRVGDTVARVGGDEFVVLQVGIAQADEARLLAHRIVRTLRHRYDIDGHEARIGVTVGIALAPRHGLTLDRVAGWADDALYQAKRKGRGSIVIAGETPMPKLPAGEIGMPQSSVEASAS